MIGNTDMNYEYWNYIKVLQILGGLNYGIYNKRPLKMDIYSLRLV